MKEYLEMVGEQESRSFGIVMLESLVFGIGALFFMYFMLLG